MHKENEEIESNKQIILYNKAIESNPNDSFSYYNKGVYLYELKQYQDAINCYDKAIELDPKYLNAYFNKGIALDKLKQYEESIKCYD